MWFIWTSPNKKVHNSKDTECFVQNINLVFTDWYLYVHYEFDCKLPLIIPNKPNKFTFIIWNQNFEIFKVQYLANDDFHNVYLFCVKWVQECEVDSK